MSSSLITAHRTLGTGNRRVSERKKLAAVVLLFLDEENWGRLINISEAGMAFECLRVPPRKQSIGYVVEVFGLDGIAPARSTLQTEAQLVWANEGNKTAGVQFTKLTAEVERQIKRWLSSASSRMVDEVYETYREKSTATEARLRKLFSTTLKTPDQVMISAYRQYLHAGFPQIRNSPMTEILDGETRGAGDEPAPTAPVVLGPEPLTTSLHEAVQKPEENYPKELQSAPNALDEMLAPEVAQAEIPATVETSAKPACEAAPRESIANTCPVEPAARDTFAQNTLPDAVAETTPIDVAAALPDVAQAPEDIPPPGIAASHCDVVEFAEIEAETVLRQEVSSSGAQEPLAAESVETSAAEISLAAALLPGLLAETSPVKPTAAVASREPSEAGTTLRDESHLESSAKKTAELSLVDATHAVTNPSSEHTESTNPAPEKSGGGEINPKLGVTNSLSQGKSAGASFGAGRKISSVASGAWTSRREEFSKPTPPQQSLRKETRLHGAAIFSVAGCLVLLVIVGLTLTLSRANRMAAAALLENIHKPFTKNTGARGAAPIAVEPFQIQVVDINNRRWVLNFGGSTSVGTPLAPSASTPGPSPAASLPAASTSAARTLKNPQSIKENRPLQPGFPMELPQELAAANASAENPAAANSAGSSGVINRKSDAAQQQPVAADKFLSEAAKENAAGSGPSTKIPPQSPEPVAQAPEINAQAPVNAPAPAQFAVQGPAQPSVQQSGQFAAGVPGGSVNGGSANGANLVQPAVLVSSVPPVYPAEARYRKIEGNVVIDALITEAGHISSMRVISGPSMLRQAALESLRKWEYKPARLRDKSVPVHLNITITFHLR